MQTFIGTKMVRADPMSEQEFCEFMDRLIPDDKHGERPGYIVEYLDGGLPNSEHYEGYVSWSPKGVFDNSYYRARGVNFGMALEAMKIGKGARLPHWEPEVVIRAQFPNEDSLMTAPYLYVSSRNGRVPWKETMIELFSSGWEIKP